MQSRVINITLKILTEVTVVLEVIMGKEGQFEKYLLLKKFLTK